MWDPLHVVSELGVGIQFFWCRVQGSGCRVQVQGSGFRAWGSRLSVQGSMLKGSTTRSGSLQGLVPSGEAGRADRLRFICARGVHDLEQVHQRDCFQVHRGLICIG